jgi:hypothetical protein
MVKIVLKPYRNKKLLGKSCRHEKEDKGHDITILTSSSDIFYHTKQAATNQRIKNLLAFCLGLISWGFLFGDHCMVKSRAAYIDSIIVGFARLSPKKTGMPHLLSLFASYRLQSVLDDCAYQRPFCHQVLV